MPGRGGGNPRNALLFGDTCMRKHQPLNPQVRHMPIRTHCKYGHEFKPGSFDMRTQVRSGKRYRHCLVCPQTAAARMAQLTPTTPAPEMPAPVAQSGPSWEEYYALKDRVFQLEQWTVRYVRGY